MNESPQPTPVQQTTTTDPWGPQQEHLKKVFTEAERLYDDPTKPQFYPSPTFAGPSQETLASLSGTAARAMQGNPLLGQAQGEVSKTLAGDYLNPNTNPGFQSVLDTTRANVLPGLDSRFMSAGRSGGGLHGRAVGEGLGSAIGGITYGHYNAERDRMGQAVSAAPGLAQADYLDPQMLAQVGAAREAIAQQPITEAIARHEFEQNAPQGKLANYLQTVQGNYGGTSNTLGQQFLPQQSTMGTILGGLLGGVGILGGTGAFGKAGWLSDERTKKDIKRIGETDEGLGIYTFRYKWEGSELPKRMGVMAQEVAEKQPEAAGLASLMGKTVLTVDHAMVR